jgi:hypothetical protein
MTGHVDADHLQHVEPQFLRFLPQGAD